MANEVLFELIGDSRRLVQSFERGEQAGAQLDRRNQLLQQHGIKTTQQFQKEMLELTALTKEYKDDAAAVTQLTKRKKALIAEMEELTAETTKANRTVEKSRKASTDASASTSKMAGAFRFAQGAAAALAASEVVRFIGDIVKVGLDAQRSINIMGSAIEAANREFGANVGTLQEWQGFAEELGSEFEFLSNRAMAGAITRTVDMTKRLGLNADQMQVLIKRSANLSIGKTDLEGAVERVAAAMRGEAESSEYLGLSLGQTAMQAWLQERGMGDLAGKLDQAQAAQVRYLMFLEQTNEVQERAAELALTTAGRVDIMAGKWERAKEEMGNFALTAIEASGVLDLLTGNVDRFFSGANAFAKALTTGNAGWLAVAIQGQQAFDQAADTASEVTDETTEQEAAAERIKELQAQTDAILKGIRDTIAENTTETKKQATLMEQEVARREQLRTMMAQLTGEEGERLGVLLTQNRLLEQQVKLYTQVRSGAVTFQSAQAIAAEAKGKGTGTKAGKPDPIGADMLRGVGSVAEAEFQRMQQVQSEALGTMKVDWAAWFHDVEGGLGVMQQVSSQVFGGFASLAEAAFEASGKKAMGFWKMYKALAIAEALANTYTSAVAAYKSMVGIPIVGPGLAVAAAAGAVALGLSNVARIASLEPGGGGGGGGATGGGGAPVSSGRGMVSAGITSQSVTAPVPTAITQATREDRGMREQGMRMERAIQSMERAVERMPDSIRTEVRGDDLMIVVERRQGKRASMLGEFE